MDKAMLEGAMNKNEDSQWMMFLNDGTIHQPKERPKEYMKTKVEDGDVITLQVKKGEMSYWLNGKNQGVAFNSKEFSDKKLLNLHPFIMLSEIGDKVELMRRNV